MEITKYIPSAHTLEDTEKELFRTDIGINSIEGPLYCSAWGKTQSQSRRNAINIAKLLNRQAEMQAIKIPAS